AARGHGRQPSLRRRLPAAARGREPLSGAGARARPRRAPRAARRRLPGGRGDDAVLLAPLAHRCRRRGPGALRGGAAGARRARARARLTRRSPSRKAGYRGSVRVLFFVDRPGVLRQYASLVAELADRGHDVHLALRSEADEDQRPQVERLVGASPRVTAGPAPARPEDDGWRAVAWTVRALGDLARYAHPRYADAPALRARVRDKVVRRLERADDLGPLGRRLAPRVARRLAADDAALAERVIRLARRAERAIPSSPAIDAYLRAHRPDVVLVTSVVKVASPQVEFLKSARRLGIPAASCVASWDNLTNKGLLKWTPERVFV